MRFSLLSILLFSSISLFFSACDDDYTPKQIGYPRVHFPDKTYIPYQAKGAPYTFEYASCAKIYTDTAVFGEKPENPYWINVYYPMFDARIHISYKGIGKGQNSFKALMQDSYELSYKHSVKAETIDRANLSPAPHLGGQLFKIGGNAASSYQFFLTDSTKNYVRGALYFYCPPNADSLAPITKFIYRDIEHLIETFRFTNQ